MRLIVFALALALNAFALDPVAEYQAVVREASAAATRNAAGTPADAERIAGLMLVKRLNPKQNIARMSDAEVRATPIPPGFLPVIAVDGQAIAAPQTIGDIPAYLQRVHQAIPGAPKRFLLTVDGVSQTVQGPRAAWNTAGVVFNWGDGHLKLPNPNLASVAALTSERAGFQYWSGRAAGTELRVAEPKAQLLGLYATYPKQSGERLSEILFRGGVFEVRKGEIVVRDRAHWKLPPGMADQIDKLLGRLGGKPEDSLALALHPDNLLVTFRDPAKTVIDRITLIEPAPRFPGSTAPATEMRGLNDYLHHSLPALNKKLSQPDPLSPLRREAAVYQGQLPPAALTLRPENLRTGDIIGISSRHGGTPWMVQASTLSPIDHVAVVVWDGLVPYVYHFTNSGGAHRVPLDTFLRESTGRDGDIHFSVSRLKEAQGPAMAEKLRIAFNQMIDRDFRNSHQLNSGCAAFVRDGYAQAGIEVGMTARADQGNLSAFDGSLRKMWAGIVGGHELIPPVSILLSGDETVGSNLRSLRWTESEMVEAWRAGDASKIARLHQALVSAGGTPLTPEAFLDLMGNAAATRAGHAPPTGSCPWFHLNARAR